MAFNVLQKNFSLMKRGGLIHTDYKILDWTRRVNKALPSIKGYMSRRKQRVKGTNAVGHRDESEPKKKKRRSEKQDEEELLQDKWTIWRPERVTDEGYATSEYISCALRMHESIYSTTRSCEPLLNRTAFSFRSPFIGRNLRSLKRRHGTTRADLYIASLPLLPVSLLLSLSLGIVLRV